LLLIALIVTSHASAQETREAAKADPMAAESAQQGKRLFQQSCAMCHGSEAKGGSGPNLIESSLVRHDEGGDLIGKVIREGISGQGMPSFAGFHSDQVADLVAFLHAAVKASDRRSAGEVAGGSSLQGLLTGNAELGKKYFDGPGKCATCHSPAGDLHGVAGKYSPLELMTRILYPPVKSKSCVVVLPSGETVKGQLLHEDAFYVALLDETGAYRSFQRTGQRNEHVTVTMADPLQGHMELLHRYTDKDIHDVFAYLETMR
jgi:cytochrome c oxidase cbb3-type subunit 3